jgi:hypothetical protein
MKFELSRQIFEKKSLKYQVLLKSVHLGAEFFHADRRTETDMTTLVFPLRNFANVPKNGIGGRAEADLPDCMA